jgi:predicted ATPase
MPRTSKKRDASGPFVLEVQLRRDIAQPPDAYPFSLPMVRALDKLALHPRVTFLLGENGAGKSTLLEAIAVAVGVNPEGGSRNLRFQTRASHSLLGESLRLVRGSTRPPDAFFVRSETLYTLATALEDPSLDDVLKHYGHKSLHERSRGEALMALVTNRLRLGFYLFDEPEAGLSPTRQLAFLAAMHQLVRRGSQLVLATHSPILLAYPDSLIYELADGKFTQRAYEATDHYQVTADFFAHRELMLKELLTDD